MTGEQTTQINVEVPKRTKDLAKEELDHGGLTRIVRQTLQQVAHGETVSEIERTKDHLNELRDKRRDLKQERNAIDSKLEDISVKIERAESRLDDLRDKEGEYEGALQVLEQSMKEEGFSVFVGHGRITDIATIGECSQEDVIEDLKERNPDLPPERFEANLGET